MSNDITQGSLLSSLELCRTAIIQSERTPPVLYIAAAGEFV